MITIKFGEGNQVQRSVFDFPTIESIQEDAGLQAYFGFGDNVDIYLVGNGLLSEDAETVDGATYSIVTKANTKG